MFKQMTTWSFRGTTYIAPSPYVNIVRLIGRVVGPSGLTYVEDEALCSFVISTTNMCDDFLVQHAETPGHRVTAIGNLGEVCNDILPMGALVQVDGHLQSQWKLTDEELYSEEYETNIIVDGITILDGIKVWQGIEQDDG